MNKRPSILNIPPRNGGGRPCIDPRMKKEPVGYKLPLWLIEWIREQYEPASVLIENALREKHNIHPPL